MEKEFVPYDLALRLKALGFNEPCLGYRDGSGIVMIARTPHCFVSAPTFSQAFRWFREKHKLRAWVQWGSEYLCLAMIQRDNGTIECVDEGVTDAEAELACLDKLIEIVESKVKK